MFIDEATLYVTGGKGGDGCCSFRREKYVPRGGPDGGDGGHGGSVYLVVNPNYSTLMDIPTRTVHAAENGRPGHGQQRHGRNGADLEIHVPPGTVVQDAGTGMILRDLTRASERVCAARGGKGGRGNKHFATPTHRAPREFEFGEEGEERTIRLELKLIADVGLVGLPNAGKSTLLSRVSDAHPKIAAYPFTTLEPQLGIVEVTDDRRIVLADLPGLIEGAHAGHGLGDEFLKHIERTRVLCHVVDMAPLDDVSPPDGYRLIREELRKYSKELFGKPHVIAANKMDLTDAEVNLRLLRAAAPGVKAYPISAATGSGVADLMRALLGELDHAAGREHRES